MFDIASLEPVSEQELTEELAAAIRQSAGGRMTRQAEVFLAGLCAEHLADRLAMAGFIFLRKSPGPS